MAKEKEYLEREGSNLENIAREESKKKVLIVDGNDTKRNLFNEFLNKDYITSEADTIEEAIEQSYLDDFDTILINTNIAKDKGMSLLETIKSSKPETKVIFISSSNKISVKAGVEAMKNGASDFLSNPNERMLKTSLSNVLDDERGEAKPLEDEYFRILEKRLEISDLKSKAQYQVQVAENGEMGRTQENISLAEGANRELMHNILLVYKDRNKRKNIELKLKNQYNILNATDAVDALNLIKLLDEEKIDVIIADIEDAVLSEAIRLNHKDAGIIITEESDLITLKNERALKEKGVNSYITDINRLEFEIDTFLKDKEYDRETRKRLKESVVDLERKKQEEPDNGEFHFQLGEIYKKDKKIKNRAKASTAFYKSFELRYKPEESLYNLAALIDEVGIENVSLPPKIKKNNSIIDFISKIFGGAQKSNEINEDEIQKQKSLANLSIYAGDLDGAIAIYEGIIEMDPNSAETYIRLGIAQMKKGDQKEAEKTFRKLTENVSKNELYVGQEHLREDLLEEGLLLAEISQHEVYDVVPKELAGKYIIKIYKKDEEAIAKKENNNLQVLYGAQEKLVMPNGTLLKVPKPILFEEGKYSSILILERMAGNRVDNEITGKHEENLSHLEQLVDAAAILGLVRTNEKNDLIDVRDQQFESSVGEIGFYTKRFLDKFVNQLQMYEDIHLSNDEEKEIVELFKPIEDILLNAPDFLYKFYTDCNYRNFVISQYPSTGKDEFEEDLSLIANPALRSKRISQAERARFDFEADDIRLGLLDIMTVLEHEINTSRRVDDNDYLVQRYILNIINPELENSVAEKVNSLLKENDRKEIQSLFGKVFLDYIQKKGLDFSLDDLDQLTLASSCQRHFTIYGDKARDIYQLNNKIDNFRKEKPEIVEQYETSIQNITEFEENTVRRQIIERCKVEFKEEMQKESNNEQQYEVGERAKQLYAYASLLQRRDEIKMYKMQHIKRLNDSLRDLGFTKLHDKLKTHYDI